MAKRKYLLRGLVERLGDAGDVVEVSQGYARNFLLPRKLAVPATPQILARHEKDHERRKRRDAGRKEDAAKLAERLQSLTLTVHAQAGADGKLFGSVTSRQIVQELEAQGIRLPAQQVLLEETLKEVGVHTVALRLHPEVEASVRVWIVEK